MSKSESSPIELEDRDPFTLSQHVQVNWPDVIGEPESFRSPECAWRLSSQCFNNAKNVCYIILAVIVAPISALCLGCTFACFAFQHIWCLNPCIRMWRINFAAVRTLVTACAQATIVPIFEAFGACFSVVKVRTQVLPEGPDHKDDILIV